MTDFNPRRDVQAISHLNVVVDDIEVATEFYGTPSSALSRQPTLTVLWITRL